MSNPYSALDEYAGFQPDDSGEFRRISARPIERLTEAKDMLGDQYWLFVGICLVGLLIQAVVPLGVLMGPMICGMYLCFRYRMAGIQVRFETLFKGFEVFLNALLAYLIMIGFSLVVMLPLVFLFIGAIIAAGPQNEEAFLAIMFTMYPVILIVSILVSIPFVFVFPLIVDRGTGPWESVTLSVRAVWHNFGPLCGMMFVHTLAGMAGMCLCYFGAFLVIPLTFGAMFTVYHEIFGSPVNVPPAAFNSPPLT